MEPMTGKSLEEYEAKARAKLISIGFEMTQPHGLWAIIDNKFLIDFSSIDPDKYLIHASREIYHMGYDDGQKSVKEVLRNLIE